MPRIGVFDPDATAPTTSAVGDSAGTGTAGSAARRDHVHGRESFGASAAAVGTSSAGVATTPSRSDHVHATGAGTPSTQAFGDAAAVGTGPAAAMTDHKHGIPAMAGGGRANLAGAVTVGANDAATAMVFPAAEGNAQRIYLGRAGTMRSLWGGLVSSIGVGQVVTSGTLTITVAKGGVTQSTLSITGSPVTASPSWTFAAGDNLYTSWSSSGLGPATTYYACLEMGWEWN